VTVVSSTHHLAATRGVASKSAIAKHVQLVLTDRTTLSEAREYSVLFPLTWRLADMGAKHAFLRAGLGWGHIPLHMVKTDLDAGTLVKIRVEDTPRSIVMPMKLSSEKTRRRDRPGVRSSLNSGARTPHIPRRFTSKAVMSSGVGSRPAPLEADATHEVLEVRVAV
jgi:DNA-binding transcriptional LysR family regulator